MDGRCCHFCSFFTCKSPRRVLAVFWLGGLFFGTVISLTLEQRLQSYFHAALNSHSLFLGLLFAQLLPVVISFIVAFTSKPLFLTCIAFLKSCFFSCISLSLLNSFGSSGWMICCLLMFSDLLVMPILWWIWLNILTENHSFVFHKIFAAIVMVFVICFCDYTFVAPFLAYLI